MNASDTLLHQPVAFLRPAIALEIHKLLGGGEQTPDIQIDAPGKNRVGDQRRYLYTVR